MRHRQQSASDGPAGTAAASPQYQPNIADDAFLVAQGCSPADITALVKTILPGPLGTLVAAKLALLNLDRTGGRVDRARAKMFEIVDALIKAEAGGLYANDPVKHGKLDGAHQAPLLSRGPAHAADRSRPRRRRGRDHANESRRDGADREQAGRVADRTGDVPQTVLVTITKIPTGAPWLDTQLDQYGPGYEFSVTPVVLFDEDILAGACINSTGDFALDTRLRLAHNNATGPLGTGNSRFGNIEIISETAGELGPLGLICTPQIGLLERMFMPERLYAAGSPPTTGGKVRTYSPFAAVDPLLTVSANSAASQSGAAGAAVGAAPSVKVVTHNGTLINGVSVGFVPTAGSGSVTGGTQTTSAGIATVGSWTINAGPTLSTRRRVRPASASSGRRWCSPPMARSRRPTSGRPGTATSRPPTSRVRLPDGRLPASLPGGPPVARRSARSPTAPRRPTTWRPS